MKLSLGWLMDFVPLPFPNNIEAIAPFPLRLAEDLTNVGLAATYSGRQPKGLKITIGPTGAVPAEGMAIDFEITTNRPDAMNHYGVAREAAAIYDLPLKALSATELQASAHPGTPFPITVEEPELCPRFSARAIRDTSIRPSPEKISRRLELIEQKRISNAVDATNYVLWEMGKPTHVFDMDLLEGGRLIIRKARNGEKLKTLDGVERTLTSEDLVVADAKKPVGLAGVMGGFDTMITGKTKNILIESAWWDPGIVRKMSRRHGLHTDASHRFERGADFESTVLSCDLVAALILESGGGELVGDAIDVVSKKMDQAPVVLRLSEVHRILGGNLSTGQIFGILKRLGFTLIPEGQGMADFRVQIPSWRLDVEREIDVIEEIARMHGYDKFENTLPAYSGAVVELPQTAIDSTLRARALALGYNEAISLTFISHADAERFSSASVLELENPLSEEASVMRTSMAPGMLEMLAWNLNRDSENVRLFEMGRVYEMRGGERVEAARACLGATLAAVRDSLPVGGALDVSKGEQAAIAEAFRGFKGDVENLLAAFAARELSFDRETAEYFHPGRSTRALMDGAVVAQFGQIAENVKAERKLRQDVFLAEIDLERLYALGLRTLKFTPLGKYPAVERDFSFVFSDEVEFESIRQAVIGLGLDVLRSFTPVEIFRGGSIVAGKHSVLLRARLQSDEGTLRDDQIAIWSAKIVATLQGLGGVQRA